MSDKYRLSIIAKVHMHKVLAQSLDSFIDEVPHSHPEVGALTEEEIHELKVAYMEAIIRVSADLFNEGDRE